MLRLLKKEGRKNASMDPTKKSANFSLLFLLPRDEGKKSIGGNRRQGKRRGGERGSVAASLGNETNLVSDSLKEEKREETFNNEEGRGEGAAAGVKRRRCASPSREVTGSFPEAASVGGREENVFPKEERKREKTCREKKKNGSTNCQGESVVEVHEIFEHSAEGNSSPTLGIESAREEKRTKQQNKDEFVRGL